MQRFGAFLGGIRLLALAAMLASVWAVASPAEGFAQPVTAMVAQGGEAPTVSATGRFVGFESLGQIFLKDTQLNVTERIDVSTAGVPANDSSWAPQVSANGRYVLFGSAATNLVPHDTNDFDDVFLRDRKLGTTKIVPHVTEQVEGTWVMSDNARYFVYASVGHDPGIYRFDRTTGSVITSTVGRDEASAIGISQNGRTALVWGSDGPRIWKPLTGRQFRFDQAKDAGFANSDVEPEALSADGNVVMFGTDATNLVRRDTNHAFDVFIRNLRTGHTRRVSVGGVRQHRQANGYSVGLALSQHGEYRLFWSAATNLVSGDRNAKIDIFLRSGPTHTTRRCNVSTAGDEGARGSRVAALSLDGSYIAFRSGATNLVPNDTDGKADIFSRSPGC